MNIGNLKNWGLDQDLLSFYKENKVKESILGRVIEVQKGKVKVITDEETYWCALSGKYLYTHGAETDMPAVGVDSHVTCGFVQEDIDKIRQLIAPGKTVVFTGSSGVGKSTLINGLIGSARQKNQTLRDDDQGRHTTTYRELILLEGGGLLVDTPGMREIGLLGDEEEGLRKSFADIETLMRGCKFSNCSHTKEKGCLVLESLENGDLSRERYDSYIKLLKESEYMQRKNDKHLQKSYLRGIGKKSKTRKKIKY